MAILISIHEISKTFGQRPLFKGLTFSLQEKEKIGLIGPNGAGKSTLLKILADITTPDTGTVSRMRGLKVALLEQTPTFAADSTVLSTVLEGTSDPYDWENISLAHEMISQLELADIPEEAPVSSLSGGQKKRLALARELCKRPELLLLDEPTNHLDVESIMWLEEFISRSNFATVTITHDRVFLQKVSNRIIEIDPRYEGGMLSVNGDYATYLELREQTLGAQEKREIILKNTLRREVEWLRQGVKARGTKQQARIQRAGELKKEVSELETRNLNRKALINFEGAEKNPKKLIEATDISKSYGENELFSHVNLLLSPGSRLGILGRNGQGKSTLIRVLLKTEEPTSGSVKHADNIRISYFDQAREALDPLTTVSKVICPSGDKVTYRGELIHYKGYLDRFLFTKEQMDFPVGKLSGGEQSRLLLAKLMLTTANVLVLDEPTNDLDVATLNILQDCLTEFPGSIILVTHDRYFLDQVATKILAFPVSMTDKSKNLTSFSDLSQWENWYEEEILKAKEISLKKTNEVTPLKLKKQKLSFKEQKELESMESKISECEKEIETLQREITLPENMSRAAILAQLSQELEEKQSCLEKLYKRWSELESH